MSDQVTIGAGTTLQFGPTGVSPVFGAALGKLTGITPAKTKVAKAAIDTFDAPLVNGLPVEDCIPGWIAPGTWQIKLKSVASILTTLNGIIGTPKTWKIIKRDGSGYLFQGYIDEIGEEIPLKETIETSFSIQINGGTVSAFSAVEA
jgi:hypothetical protein